MTAGRDGMTGGCLCGAVRYRIEGPASAIWACHCSQCRRSGGHYLPATSVARADLVVEGEVAWYESTPGRVQRGFCPVCGSSLFWRRVDESTVDVWAGTLDAPTGLRLERHIYVADKGDYYEITDGLPQHPRGKDT